jgi:hypothetical protein
MYVCALLKSEYGSDKKLVLADLREDKQFFLDHPGLAPISTAQASSTNTYNVIKHTCSWMRFHMSPSCYASFICIAISVMLHI